ncbi:MAG: ribosome-associated translation inhibitor RaiA [Thiotrichales bacterium]|jgi:putative sigma-54 modulation protein|nr:ribosome-associated translation inhibitor RaiA [Thiotrichales bacterium]MBT3613019.1 ribosome-associated translation inhibitor RaiA [Thiotrichales bacterium]MBT3752817.1 ribosome-associated translation inhibitor RaiA [Thiotrichales bacterium]MBT3837200.1 ribosome-associated translation inhibitor RaiA [Thiotrichales bacterium]MBT4152783.1 ribosome-associated translation inhibitor RaiA [Thiotrichales bacterium]
MQLNITGNHIEVTEAMKSYVTEKMGKLERHFDHVTNVHVIFSIEKSGQKVEATLHISGGEIFAESVADDMYASIDALIGKLDRQVIKHKEKLQKHR